ncbi:synaptonemal complex protein 1 isoform X4 [Dasypus novemcinctus]|uniref:synaptonemal complex protein 1 isoform X4 n=1 Tax=Dasypus novemcinctus TaxID=9361 RepID=UPI0039C9BE43
MNLILPILNMLCLQQQLCFFQIFTTGREEMEKQKPFKLFVPPRLSSSQVSAVKPQTLGGDSKFFKSFNKCIEDDFGLPFAMTKTGENIDSDPALQKVNFLPMLEQVDNSESCHYQEGLKDSDFENSEPMSRLYSKLYKEAEKIKKWKVSVESELKQKETKLQENRKIIEAQRKAIQELQFENEKVSLKLEEGIQENKDLIKENNATRHLCNLLKETCARSAEKTKKYLQNDNLKESKEKEDHLTSELEDMKMSLQRSVTTQKTLEEDLQIATKTVCQLTGEKEAQMDEFNKAKAAHSFVVTELKTTISNLKDLLATEEQRLGKNEDQLKILTMEFQKKSSELEEMTKFKNNIEVKLEELKKILAENQKLLDEKKKFEKIAEELKGRERELTDLLQTREEEVHNLELRLSVIAMSEQHYSEQVKDLKTELENEKLKNTELTASLNKLTLENKELAQETSDMAVELKKQQEYINHSKKQEERMLKQIENLEETETQLRNELESVREELKQKGDEVKCKLDKSEENARNIECEVLKKEKQMKILENKCNNLKKQVENKSKCIEELQQENKAFKKKSTAESKQLNAYEIKVNKLELELECAKQKFEEMTDTYQKEIKDKKISEENLLDEVEKAKIIAEEAVKLQKEIDIRCQHKIAEMVALMEKHKHQYDKIVEERDSELGLYKSKEQEQSSLKASLEIELSNLKNELSSIKKQLDLEREEKEKFKREAKENTVALKEKKDKKTQTTLLETPETSYWKFDSKAAPSQSTSQNFTSADHGKSKNKRDYLWTSAKSTLSTPLPKAYTVKTPTKVKLQQKENQNLSIEESNKKRKMVFEFDINSDSSETTDLLSMVSEEETLQKLHKNNHPPASFCVSTPKKTPSSLKTPGSTLKFGAMRKTREDCWATIAKMDRKKKLKEAEKLFV